MKICVLVTKNHISGGTKSALRLAQHLSLFHDVAAYYPVVPYYFLTAKTLSPIGKARHVLRVVRQSWPAVILRFAQNDSGLTGSHLRCWAVKYLSKYVRSRIHFDEPGYKLRYEWYLLHPNRDFLAGFDAIIYLSPWSYQEVKDTPGARKIFWCTADYLHTTIRHSIGAILEAYHSSDRLIAKSEFIRRSLAIVGAKVHGSIGGAIDKTFHLSQERCQTDTISVLGYFHHFSAVKGAPTLLKVLFMLRAKYPELQIDLWGPGGSNIANQAPHICNRYYSNLTPIEAAALYREHSIFLYPGYTDGFQSPPLEAMASGCAVVATDVGGVPEYAVHEHNALICPPMDADAMFECADRLIQDASLRERLAHNAVEEARKWTWESCAEKFNELLEESA